jgi:hypothetical protein
VLRSDGTHVCAENRYGSLAVTHLESEAPQAVDAIALPLDSLADFVAGCRDEGSAKVPETVSKKHGARGRFELIKTQAQAGTAKKT